MFTVKNVFFIKNHYSAYSLSFWKSYDEKKKFFTPDVTNRSPIPKQVFNPKESKFGMIRIESEWIRLSRVDYQPIYIERNLKSFSQWFQIALIRSDWIPFRNFSQGWGCKMFGEREDKRKRKRWSKWRRGVSMASWWKRYIRRILCDNMYVVSQWQLSRAEHR